MAYINGNEVLFSAQVTQANSNVDVDTEMSDTSENPVENKAIKNYIDSEVATLRDDHNTLYNQVQNMDENMDERFSMTDETIDALRAPATSNDLGMVLVSDTEQTAHSDSGIVVSGEGRLSLVCADETAIVARENRYAPIVPANLEYAVKSVGDGYYLKAEDVTGSIEFIVVAELPTEDIKNAIYLIPAEDGEEDNAYDEYIYTNGAWEKIGSASVKVDMSQYLEKNTESASLQRVYGVETNGVNKMLNASVNPFGDALVKYVGGGRIRVSEPTEDNNATTKAYVDGLIEELAARIESLEEAFLEHQIT